VPVQRRFASGAGFHFGGPKGEKLISFMWPELTVNLTKPVKNMLESYFTPKSTQKYFYFA